jgi:hypothetical protein
VPVHGTPAKSFDFSFLQIPPGNEPEVIETDVVIVGSGCGGGVVAKNLAEAGYKVLIVDKSYHWPSDHYPMTEQEGWVHLFHNGGFLFCKSINSFHAQFIMLIRVKPTIALLVSLPVRPGEVVELSTGLLHCRRKALFAKNGQIMVFLSSPPQTIRTVLMRCVIVWG